MRLRQRCACAAEAYKGSSRSPAGADTDFVEDASAPPPPPPLAPGTAASDGDGEQFDDFEGWDSTGGTWYEPVAAAPAAVGEGPEWRLLDDGLSAASSPPRLQSQVAAQPRPRRTILSCQRVRDGFFSANG